MIGFYNYSVIVTYIGVALSVSGMALASTGQFKFAILCLALAGACDTFDGKIARAMKNRTKEMEIFGIQIDSLCDMVCFGVTPVIISYHTNPETDQAKGYRGLPITTITIIYPIVYLFHPLVSHETFLLFLAIMHIVVAFLYVLDFKLKKPGNSVIAAMMVLVTAVMVCILFVE